MLPASAILDAGHAKNAGYFEEKIETRASSFLDKSKTPYRFFVYKEETVESKVTPTAEPSGVVPKTRAFVDRLGINEHEIVKTLIFMDCDTKVPFVILMHGDCMVNSRKLAKAVGAKRVTACPVDMAQEFSGYVVGGTSPFGLKTPMRVLLQETVLQIPNIIINGGGKSHYLYMDPKDIGKALQAPHAVEAGFQFGLVDCKQERRSDNDHDDADKSGGKNDSNSGNKDKTANVKDSNAPNDKSAAAAKDANRQQQPKKPIDAVAAAKSVPHDDNNKGKNNKSHLSASAAAFTAPNGPGKNKDSGKNIPAPATAPEPTPEPCFSTITISLNDAPSGTLDTANIPENEISKSGKSGIPSGSNTPGLRSQPRSRRTSNANPPSQCRAKLLEEMKALFLVFPRHNMGDTEGNAAFAHGFPVDASKIDDFDLIVDDFDKLSSTHKLLTTKTSADPDHLAIAPNANNPTPQSPIEDDLRQLGEINLTLPVMFPLHDDTCIPLRIHVAVPVGYPHEPLRASITAAASVDLRANIDVAGLSSGLNMCAQRIAHAGTEAIFAMRTYAIDHAHKYAYKPSQTFTADGEPTQELDYDADFTLSQLNRVRNRVPPHDGFVGVSSPASLVDVRGGELIPLLGKPKGHIKIGLVGLPNVGKSSLFNLLSGMRVPAQNYPFCTIDPNVATIPIADHRYRDLLDVYKPAKHSPAVVSVVDIAGLVKGASKGRGLGNAFLHYISTVQVVYQVIRIFEDKHVVHVEGNIDPLRDIQVINRELLEKDLEQMHARIKRLNRPKFQQWAPALAKKENEELSILLKAHEWLLQGQPLRLCRWTPQEAAYLSTLQMWTSKPMCYLLNMSAEQYACEKQREKAAAAVKAWVHTYAPDCGVVCVSVSYEEAKLICGEDAEPWLIVAVANKLLEIHKRAELEEAERAKLIEEMEEKKRQEEEAERKKKEKEQKQREKEKSHSSHGHHSHHGKDHKEHKESKEVDKKDKKDKKKPSSSFGGDLGLSSDTGFGFDSFLQDSKDLAACVKSDGHGDKKDKKDKHADGHKHKHHDKDHDHKHKDEAHKSTHDHDDKAHHTNTEELDPQLHRDIALSGRPAVAPAAKCTCAVCSKIGYMDVDTARRVTELAFNVNKDADLGDVFGNVEEEEEEEEQDKAKDAGDEVDMDMGSDIKGAKGRLLWLREDSALSDMLRAGYGMARLRQVFIAYPQLVKGFMVPWACKAPQAAARVHYDLANTFVSCEVCAFDDWKKSHRSMAEARENGVVKTQGKNYEVRDGDILMFKGLNKNKLGF